MLKQLLTINQNALAMRLARSNDDVEVACVTTGQGRVCCPQKLAHSFNLGVTSTSESNAPTIAMNACTTRTEFATY